MTKVCMLLQSIEKETVEDTRMTMRLNSIDGGKTLDSELQGSQASATIPLSQSKAKIVMLALLRERPKRC